MQFVDRVPQATVVLLTAFFLQGYLADELPHTAAESKVQNYLNLIIALSVVTTTICTITTELVAPDDALPIYGLPYMLLMSRKNQKKKEEYVKEQEDVQFIDSASVDPRPKGKHVKRRGNTKVSKSGKVKLKNSAVFAIILNWTGFILCTAINVIYPVVAFVIMKSSNPPPMPQPPDDNLTESYYADAIVGVY